MVARSIHIGQIEVVVLRAALPNNGRTHAGIRSALSSAMNKRLRGIPALEQPAIYRIVGEHRADPARLLVLGADGLYYALTLHEGRTSTVPVVPGDDWLVDLPAGTEDFERRPST